jgi:hypothetical protein
MPNAFGWCEILFDPPYANGLFPSTGGLWATVHHSSRELFFGPEAKKQRPPRSAAHPAWN